MKNKLFLLFWLSFLALCSCIVGVLALLGVANAEVIFWSANPIESKAGKIGWVVGSVLLLIFLLGLTVREYRKSPPHN